MKVAILFSGGKDSTFAIDYAIEKGWEIAYLLSVKPANTECYLFHFATVENTVKQAEILGLKHILIPCTVADPQQEAELVKNVVAQNLVDAVILGGTGLQETQIRSIQNALKQLHVEAFAAHAGLDHDNVMKHMISKGYRFMITQIATDGLGKEWLGRIIDETTLQELFTRSIKYGFHCGGEGGYYDTFVVDGPIFKNKIELVQSHIVMEDAYCGHLVIDELKVAPKIMMER